MSERQIGLTIVSRLGGQGITVYGVPVAGIFVCDGNVGYRSVDFVRLRMVGVMLALAAGNAGWSAADVKPDRAQAVDPDPRGIFDCSSGTADDCRDGEPRTGGAFS